MSSEEKREDNEDDTSTKHILDYYKKFSQNRELTKYFSGSSVSYLPEIINPTQQGTQLGGGLSVPPPELREIPNVVITTNVDVVILSDTEKSNEDVEQKDASRASSSSSNRKLEWDCGADIGYENCEKGEALSRSSSLPLLTEVKGKKVNFDVASDPENICENSNKSTRDIVLSSSSSSNNELVEKCESSSTSSSAQEQSPPVSSGCSTSGTSSGSTNLTPSNCIDNSNESSERGTISKFGQTLLYLKQKIGLPDAQSTPKEFGTKCLSQPQVTCNVNETPFIKKDDRFLRKKSEVGINDKPTVVSVKKSSSDTQLIERKLPNTTKNEKSRKVVNLCVTKPVVVECMSISPLTTPSEILQTETKISSIAIQTDVTSEKLTKTTKRSANKNQPVVQFDYDSNTHITCSSQTSSEMVEANCDSFQYVKNCQSVPPKNRVIVSNYQVENVAVQQATQNKKIKNIEPTIKLKRTELKSKQKEPKHEQTTIKSSNGEDEMETGDQTKVAINEIEQEIYLLQKLIKSKKYDSATKKKYIRKIMQRLTKAKYIMQTTEDSSTSSELFYPKQSKVDVFSKGNSPGINATEYQNFPDCSLHKSVRKPLRRKTLGVKTFNEEILPPKEALSVDPATDTFHVNNFPPTKNDFTNSDVPLSTLDVNEFASLEKQCKSSSLSKSYDNWREDKTLSEKLLEKKNSSSENDYLVNVANKEREYQLTWINNEISHLSKLRNLLNRVENSLNKRQSKSDETLSHRKSTVDIKRHKTVYKVTESNEDTSGSSGTNFVIETELGVRTASNINFHIGGKQYRVEELGPKIPNSRPSVVGDIKVSSHDNITNIKVTTSCEKCNKSPCNGTCIDCDKDNCFYSNTCDCLVCSEKNTLATSSVCDRYKKILSDLRTQNTIASKERICSEISTDLNNRYTGQAISSMERQKSQLDNACLCCKNCGKIYPNVPIQDQQFPDTNSNSINKIFERCICALNNMYKCLSVGNDVPHLPSTSALKENVDTEDSPTEAKSISYPQDPVQNFPIDLTQKINKHKPVQVKTASQTTELGKDSTEVQKIFHKHKTSKLKHNEPNSTAVQRESDVQSETVTKIFSIEDKAVEASNKLSDIACQTSGRMDSPEFHPNLHRTSGNRDRVMENDHSNTATMERMSGMQLETVPEILLIENDRDVEATRNASDIGSQTSGRMHPPEMQGNIRKHRTSKNYDRGIQNILLNSTAVQGKSDIQPRAFTEVLSDTTEKGLEVFRKKSEIASQTSGRMDRSEVTANIRKHRTSKNYDRGVQDNESNSTAVQVKSVIQHQDAGAIRHTTSKASQTSVDDLTHVATRLQTNTDNNIGFQTAINDNESKRNDDRAEVPRNSYIMENAFRGTSYDRPAGVTQTEYNKRDKATFSNTETKKIDCQTTDYMKDSTGVQATSDIRSILSQTSEKGSVLHDFGVQSETNRKNIISQTVRNSVSDNTAVLAKPDLNAASSQTSREIYSYGNKSNTKDVAHQSSCNLIAEGTGVQTVSDKIYSQTINFIPYEVDDIAVQTTLNRNESTMQHESRVGVPSKSNTVSKNSDRPGEKSHHVPEISTKNLGVQATSNTKPVLLQTPSQNMIKATGVQTTSGSIHVASQMSRSYLLSAETQTAILSSKVQVNLGESSQFTCKTLQASCKSTESQTVANKTTSTQKLSDTEHKGTNTACNSTAATLSDRRVIYKSAETQTFADKTTSTRKLSDSEMNVVKPVWDATTEFPSNAECQTSNNSDRFSLTELRQVTNSGVAYDRNNGSEKQYEPSRDGKPESTENESRKNKFKETSSNGLKQSNYRSSSNGTYVSSSELDTPEQEKVMYVICVCCKLRTPSQTASYLLAGSHTYYLCTCCAQRRPILTACTYDSPTHTCSCYAKDSTDSSQRVLPQGHCSCVKPCQMNNYSYCGHCIYKLRKTARSTRGIAYMLTLENEIPTKLKTKKKKSRVLEEIKIKVPNPYHRKKIKDKENYNKKDGDKVNDNDDHVADRDVDDNQEKEDNQYTLQEYLVQNRPDFIDSAEYRRNILINSKESRIELRDDVRMKFLEDNINGQALQRKPKLYSEREMKEITKRNYKKLPEVQGRLKSEREKRLRNADKVIADTLTRKIKENVLKGRKNFPIDTNVVSLPT